MILLLLSPAVAAPKSTQAALDRAAKNRTDLVVLVALPREAVLELAGTLTDEAFVGDRLSDEVVDALRREQRSQAEHLLRSIIEQAKKKAINVTTLVEVGEPNEICARVVAAHNIAHVILPAHRRSWLARWWSPSAHTDWLKVLGCEVEVVEEET
jgi:hypothetical protein